MKKTLSVRLFVFITILFLSSFYVQAQNELSSVDFQKLGDYFEKARRDWNVPGMAIAIVKDDKVVFSKGYGVCDINKNDKVDENTLFAIASNTKSFTAAALAILVDEGKISWDDRVIRYLPWFQLYDPYVTNEMNIRDLLCHRTGLATFSGDLLWYGTVYDREEVVRRARFLKPVNGFREEYGYSNIMYLAAGLIIEKISGKSWDEFVREKFFIPLGMRRSNSSVNALEDWDNVASPHTFSKEKVISIPYLNWDNIAPAGGINSSIADMSQWIRLQLNKGSLDGREYFSKVRCDEMWKAYTPMKIGPDASRLFPSMHFRAYGLGWALFDYYGRKVVNHSGGYDGMISYTGLVPEEKFGFVILTNANSWVFYPLVYKILDTFLSTGEKDWSNIFLEYENQDKEFKSKEEEEDNKNRIQNTKPTLPLKLYSGSYQCEMYGDARISYRDGLLFLEMLPAPLFKAKLTHWQYNTFRLVFDNFPSLPPGKVNFTINDKGEVDEMQIDVPNPDFDFTELKFFKKHNED